MGNRFHLPPEGKIGKPPHRGFVQLDGRELLGRGDPSGDMGHLLGTSDVVVGTFGVCYKEWEVSRPWERRRESCESSMELSDEDLVALAQEGDRKAFEELVLRHQERAYSLALHMCMGDTEEAQDLTQEAFLRAFKNIKNFRGDSSFYTWFFRIVVNTCLDGRRKRLKWENLFSFRRQKSHDDDETDELEVQPDTAPGRDPMAVLSEKRLTRDIKRALKELPPRQRMALQLKVIEGMSLKEIAEIMGAAEGTVKSHLFRATHKLQEVLKDWV
jgi:RNA polymerase sigma-70 factor (ECF subfamily)